MLSALLRWFKAPIFNDNEDKTHSALLLNAILNTAIIALPVVIGGLLAGHSLPRIGTSYGILVVAWVLLVGIRFLMIAGYVAPAGISLVIIIYTTTTLAIYNLGTIRAPATSFYVLVVVIAGLIVNRRAIIITAGVCTATVMGFFVAEQNGLLPDPNLTTTITQVVTFTVSMWITGILLFIATRGIDEALARSRQEVASRKQTEEELQYFNARLEIIHEIDRALLSSNKIDKIALDAIIRIRQLIPSQRASVTLFDHTRKEARFLIADSDNIGEIPDTPISFEGFGQRVIDRLSLNQSWFSDDILLDPQVTEFDKRLANEQHIHAWLSLPLITQGELIGALNLGRQHGSHFTPEDARIAHDIANQLAIALHQSNLYNALQHELAQRQKLITELEARNDELTRFTYTVSHDLRNPLVTIKGFLGMLKKDLLEHRPEKVENDLARISTAADKMNDLLTDLLELSRIGRIVNPPVKIDAFRLIQDALESVDADVRSKHAQVHIAPDLPVLYGDRIRLREVFENLIDNAIKYAAEQTPPTIEIGAYRENSETIFFVKDNGIGIEEKYHAKIFGLFEKLDPAIEGTGIGLALVKRIVETHGGKIWVESEGLGKGSTFYFTIPDRR